MRPSVKFHRFRGPKSFSHAVMSTPNPGPPIWSSGSHLNRTRHPWCPRAASLSHSRGISADLWSIHVPQAAAVFVWPAQRSGGIPQVPVSGHCVAYGAARPGRLSSDVGGFCSGRLPADGRRPVGERRAGDNANARANVIRQQRLCGKTDY